MTTLYLVRHGETVDNVNKILQGQTPGRLTEKGESQARDVRDRMEDVHVDVYVSSDLRRSVDTCRIIAGPRAADIVQTPLLRERDWGGFTGQYIPDLAGKQWPDDVETLEAMKDRARRFLEMIKNDYPGKTVLAVGHGIINKAIQSVYHRKPMNEIEKMNNAEVRVLKI
ncbi:MAG: histidine phosphatase family protein [Prevotella sp.]